MEYKQEKLVSEGIKNVIKLLMDKVLEKVMVEDPFIKESHHSSKPLYAALVPDEIFKGSHFERRFVTPFGSVWEKLAIVVGEVRHSNCLKGHTIEGNVSKERLRRIQEVLNNLEHTSSKEKKVKPDWDEELKYILSGNLASPIPTKVVCDIFIKSNLTKLKYSFEIKAPLPNSDQTKVSKEKMFKLLAMDPPQVDEVYFALPYNPYGTRDKYEWSFPKRWFNMKTDKSVLIGDEFWNLIGGDGTYDIFIKEINLLGKEYRIRIYKEYLGIEPPINFQESLLK